MAGRRFRYQRSALPGRRAPASCLRPPFNSTTPPAPRGRPSSRPLASWASDGPFGPLATAFAPRPCPSWPLESLRLSALTMPSSTFDIGCSWNPTSSFSRLAWRLARGRQPPCIAAELHVGRFLDTPFTRSVMRSVRVARHPLAWRAVVDSRTTSAVARLPAHAARSSRIASSCCRATWLRLDRKTPSSARHSRLRPNPGTD